jgi:hypothetical protein
LTDKSTTTLERKPIIIPATSTAAGTGSIVFNTTNQYISWSNQTDANNNVYRVTTDPSGYETVGSGVSSTVFLNTLLSGSISGSEYYISLYQDLQTTASGSLRQILNWPLKITGIVQSGGSGITFINGGIKQDDFRSFPLNNNKVGGNLNVGTFGTGVSFGALIWAADKTKRAITVQQATGSFSGIQKGALTKHDNTVLVQQNQEYISRQFGNDPNPNPVISGGT